VLLNLARSGTASHVETVVKAVRRRHTPTRRPRGPPLTDLAVGRRRLPDPARPADPRPRRHPDRRHRSPDVAPPPDRASSRTVPARPGPASTGAGTRASRRSGRRAPGRCPAHPGRRQLRRAGGTRCRAG
jgi:hypothetical protein